MYNPLEDQSDVVLGFSSSLNAKKSPYVVLYSLFVLFTWTLKWHESGIFCFIVNYMKVTTKW